METINHHTTAWPTFKAGAISTVPFMLAVLPFGVMYGVLALDLGLTSFQAMLFSLSAYAGISQIAGLQLLGEGAPLWIAAGTAIVINLRYFMYSASLSVHLRGLPNATKIPLAYMLTDQAFLTSIARFETDPQVHRGWFYCGSAVACWCSWQTGVLLGIVLGTQIPASLELDFIIPLIFIGMAVPVMKTRPALGAGISAAVMSVLAFELPLSLGTMVAASTGILVGTTLDWRQTR